MSEFWVQAAGLTKHFGQFAAVTGIDIAVRKGEVVGFLGPNGAGKTTSMRMLTGYLQPTAGSVRILDIEMEADPIGAKSRIGYLPEGAPLYGDMTPRQLLRFVAEARRMPRALMHRRIEEAATQLSLHEVLDQAIDTLSKGFKRRVGLAQAILHDPAVLILDEPTDGLDPLQKQEVRRLIREMAAEKAIIISTHILEEVEAVCTRAVIIARGQIVYDGTPEALLKRSSRHGRVLLRLRGAGAEARASLMQLASVRNATLAEERDGYGEWQLLPEGAAVDFSAVGRLAMEQGWAIEGLEVQRGDLDEVFIALAEAKERL